MQYTSQTQKTHYVYNTYINIVYHTYSVSLCRSMLWENYRQHNTNKQSHLSISNGGHSSANSL